MRVDIIVLVVSDIFVENILLSVSSDHIPNHNQRVCK
jgi:hypothetical protein